MTFIRPDRLTEGNGDLCFLFPSDRGAHHEALEDLPERAAAQLHPAEHPAVPLRPGKLQAAAAGLGTFDSRLGGEKCRRSGAR